jgi:hypothetical protein
MYERGAIGNTWERREMHTNNLGEILIEGNAWKN